MATDTLTQESVNHNAEAQWQAAMQDFIANRAAYDHYNEAVCKPVYEHQEAFEAEHGLISHSYDRQGTPGYHEKRIALLAANPNRAVPSEINDEIERRADAFSDAQKVLMQMEAPNLAALRWKLDHVLEIEHPNDEDGGSIACWTGRYLNQTIADIHRLLPAEAC